MKKRGPKQQRDNGKFGRRGAASSIFGSKQTSNRKTVDASLSPLGSKKKKGKRMKKGNENGRSRSGPVLSDDRVGRCGGDGMI
jgi:hypothetical protein